MNQPVSLLRRSALAASAVLLAAPATASEAAPVREYQAVKTRDGKPIHLTMYRKNSGGARRPVLFLVHGSSMSALSSFDLQVPGTENYSMVMAFSQAGSMSGQWIMRATASRIIPMATPTLPRAWKI